MAWVWDGAICLETTNVLAIQFGAINSTEITHRNL